MSKIEIPRLQLVVWGQRACFTRPEFPTERVSYEVPTPSAARGILEAIYWKPEFHWRIRQIHVLKPIKVFSETRNEVTAKATSSGLTQPFVTTNSTRLQRHTLGLEDVAYLLVAQAVPSVLTEEQVRKHAQIFTNRVLLGQCFHRPYLGCREWSCYFAAPHGNERAIPLTRSLGRMLFDLHFESPAPRERTIPVWYEAKMVKGVIEVPDRLYEVAGGCRGSERLPPQRPC